MLRMIKNSEVWSRLIDLDQSWSGSSPQGRRNSPLQRQPSFGARSVPGLPANNRIRHEAHTGRLSAPDDLSRGGTGWLDPRSHRLGAWLASARDVSPFAAKIPQITSPAGRLFLDIPGIVRATEDRSKAECHRLQGLVRNTGRASSHVSSTTGKGILSGEWNIAAAEARLADSSVAPWPGEHVASHDMAQAIVVGSGRPALDPSCIA